MAKHSPGFERLVAEVKGRVREVTIQDVQARLASGAAFKLVDVREDGEWAKGHVPRAVHLGKGVIERDIEQAIPDTHQEIVLYCGGGYRSALAADNLQRMGYDNVWSLAGGFRAWSEAGLPVE